MTCLSCQGGRVGADMMMMLMMMIMMMCGAGILFKRDGVGDSIRFDSVRPEDAVMTPA